MNKKIRNQLTFALLDKESGIHDLPPTQDDEYPLPTWYRSIRETPVDKLGVEDICKACRQQIHLEHIVPIALEFLVVNPSAGKLYDGELIVSLKHIPISYWSSHAREAEIVKKVIEKVLQFENEVDGLERDLKELLHILK